jgi:hypothetical protein
VLARFLIALSLLAAADLTLDNGIRISPQTSDGQSFNLVIGYQSGIRNEANSLTGMAAIVSRFLQSTASARSLALAAYGAGGTVEFLDEPDRTAVRVSVPPWAAPMVLSSAASFLTDTPDKNRDLVERARATALAEASDGPSDFRLKVEDEIRIGLLGSHPYTHPAGGWKADLEQVTTDDITRFFNENYGTDRAFLLTTSAITDDIRRNLSSVVMRKSRKPVQPAGRVMDAERTLHFGSDGPAGAVIFASPAPGVFYRGWYVTLVLDRIVHRTFRQKTSTALPLTVDPYYWRVEVPVASGQLADTVEENLVQDIDRFQFARVKPEDLEAARQDVTNYLESPYVREWFASENLESRRQEGLQWVRSLTADDVRSGARDAIVANRVVASWSPKPKQNSVQVESLSAVAASNAPTQPVNLAPLKPVSVGPFPPHSHPAKTYSTPERLGSGVWLASSSIFGIFLAGTDNSGLPDGIQRFGPNGALWVSNSVPDAKAVQSFQKYRADRILVLVPAGSLDSARAAWNNFKSNERDATVVTPQGNVANIDIPALVVLKSILDRKLIEAGWWNNASIHIDATVGATLEIDAPAPFRAQIMEWIKNIAAAPLADADFVWAREAATHHLHDVLPDVQIMLWQHVHDYMLEDLETITPAHVQDVAKLYF